MSQPAGSAEYKERLWPSPGWWAVAPIAAVAGALMVGPYGTAIWVVAALIAGALVASGLVQASARIEVSQGLLRAGRAEIPVEYLGEVTWAEGAQARAERGPQLDARAFLMIRGWVDPVLKVQIEDPQDPTPYWLISTRHPERLAAALIAARG